MGQIHVERKFDKLRRSQSTTAFQYINWLKVLGYKKKYYRDEIKRIMYRVNGENIYLK